MNKEVSNAKFELIGFFLALINCLALIIHPEIGWLPLAITFSLWFIRFAKRRTFSKPSSLHFLVFLFLVTSFISAGISYDPDIAFHKFYLIGSSILLFYSITQQPKKNTWIIISCLSLVGSITTVIFILITDWTTFPADFKIFNLIGEGFVKIFSYTRIQDVFERQFFQANIVGGINAMLIPITLATSYFFWKNRRYLSLLFILIFLSVIITGLLISSSRGAWIAVISGLGSVTILGFSNRKLAFLSNSFLYSLIPLFIILVGLFLPLLMWNITSEAPLSLSNVTSFDSRLKLAKQTYFLIADFPFTGGGLGSFPGLYSQYILVIPYFMFGYSHNLYLDLLLEQGIFGFLVWVSVIVLAAITIGLNINNHPRNSQSRIFTLSIYASLVILLIHGIFDDSIYSNALGLPLLFLIPGLSVAVSNPQKKVFIPAKTLTKISVIGLVIISTALILFHKPILATWYANIGAFNMAKTELQNWPTGEWSDISNFLVYDEAERNFQKALSYKNDDPTANYRLGLIFMSRTDFQQAAKNLEISHLTTPNHRGMKKTLGYCYTWLGKFDEAAILLKEIPEAKAEMEVYSWWWRIQSRDDLAENASQMGQQLDNHP